MEISEALRLSSDGRITQSGWGRGYIAYDSQKDAWLDENGVEYKFAPCSFGSAIDWRPSSKPPRWFSAPEALARLAAGKYLTADTGLAYRIRDGQWWTCDLRGGSWVPDLTHGLVVDIREESRSWREVSAGDIQANPRLGK